MGSYIEFVESMSHNRDLAKEFKQNLKGLTEEQLSVWFSDKGFNVSSVECSAILKNTKSSHLSNTLLIPY